MSKLVISLLIFLFRVSAAWAADEAPTAISNKEAIDLVQTHANYLWTLIAAALVFFMQAGFTMVEAGFTRAKNVINITMKNLMDFSMGDSQILGNRIRDYVRCVQDWMVWRIRLFPQRFQTDGDPWVLAFWMFQVVFAATAATIVSGALAERTKFIGYLCYSLASSAIIYPVFGSWAWGSLFNGSGMLSPAKKKV